MTRIWAVMLHTLAESHRRRIWFPFLVAAILGALVVIMGFGGIRGFGVRLNPNPYANNIISSFFMFWSWGTILTALCLGATSIPTERLNETLFTLPIHRWELLAGKIFGNWILVIGIHLVGYLISVALALHSSLPVPAYSVAGLVQAITVSFVMLCLSVPLGMRLSSLEAGTWTIFILVVLAYVTLWAFYGGQNMQSIREADPLTYAFFNQPVMLQHYLGSAANLLQGLVLLGLTGFLFRRTEPFRSQGN